MSQYGKNTEQTAQCRVLKEKKHLPQCRSIRERIAFTTVPRTKSTAVYGKKEKTPNTRVLRH